MRAQPHLDVAIEIDLAEPECEDLRAFLRPAPAWHRRVGPVLLALATASLGVVVHAEATVAPSPASPPRESPASPLPWFPAAARQPPCEGDGEPATPVTPAPGPLPRVRFAHARTPAHEKYLQRAARLEARGDYAKALVAYTWATKLAPKDPEGHVGRAMCLLELKRVREARAAVNRALRSARDHGEAMVLRGLLAQLGGQRDTARARYQSYLDAHPGGRWAGELTRVVAELGGARVEPSSAGE